MQVPLLLHACGLLLGAPAVLCIIAHDLFACCPCRAAKAREAVLDKSASKEQEDMVAGQKAGLQAARDAKCE
jgi:hypothetical protein